jgi:hypothetical protein
MPRGIPKTGKRVKRADQRRAQRPAIIDPNQFYSVPEYAAASDKSTAAGWLDVRAKRVNVVRDGTRVKVLGAEIIRANQEQAARSSAS